MPSLYITNVTCYQGEEMTVDITRKDSEGENVHAGSIRVYVSDNGEVVVGVDEDVKATVHVVEGNQHFKRITKTYR